MTADCDSLSSIGVAVETNEVLIENNETSLLDSFLTTTDIQQSTAVFFLQLLTNSSTIEELGQRIRLVLFEEGNYSESRYLRALNAGIVDVYPYPLAIGYDEPAKFHATSAFDLIHFSLYLTKNATSVYLLQHPVRFLVSPFSWRTWVAIVTCLAVLLSYYILLRRRADQNLIITCRLIRALLLLAFAVFAFSYTAKLKANMVTSRTIPPFTNLYELSSKIENGQYSLVVDRTDSLRYKIMTGKENASRPLAQLAESATRTAGAITIIPAGPELCHILLQRKDLLLFGYEAFIAGVCPGMCFWEFELTEYYPPVIRTILLSKTGRFRHSGDQFGLATVSFRNLAIERHKDRRCDQIGTDNRDLIGFRSLVGALVFICLSWIAAAVACVIEWLHFMIARKRQDFVSNVEQQASMEGQPPGFELCEEEVDQSTLE